jgi:hypothetical protein
MSASALVLPILARDCSSSTTKSGLPCSRMAHRTYLLASTTIISLLIHMAVGKRYYSSQREGPYGPPPPPSISQVSRAEALGPLGSLHQPDCHVHRVLLHSFVASSSLAVLACIFAYWTNQAYANHLMNPKKSKWEAGTRLNAAASTAAVFSLGCFAKGVMDIGFALP